MTVRLTDRDQRLLVKCALCRWLTTDQLKRTYFRDATPNAVQKRLRKLTDAGYFRSYREHPTAESVHTVGPKGKPLVEEKGVEVFMGEVPGQVEHLLGVNELRFAVEESAALVVFCFAYWQLADLGWTYRVIPDLVFAVGAPERRTFVAEFDRGTETVEKVLDKLRRYAEGLEGFPFEAVLIVTEQTRRLELLAREMSREGLAVPVLVAMLDDIRQAGLFQATFLEMPGHVKRKLLDGREVEMEAEGED